MKTRFISYASGQSVVLSSVNGASAVVLSRKEAIALALSLLASSDAELDEIRRAGTLARDVIQGFSKLLED